jgi:Domain of unknown function (DUF5076)
MKELAIPQIAVEDKSSIEMMRLWIANRSLQTSLRLGWYAEQKKVDETRAWGMIFADAIRHISNGLTTITGQDAKSSQKLILDALINELRLPTTQVSGEFVDQK